MTAINESNDENDPGEQYATIYVEKIEGLRVYCFHCNESKLMDGFIDPENSKKIKAVCPVCNSIELVQNLFN